MTKIHILILKAFDDLKFNIGKTTFVDFLKGDLNQTIIKNNLEELNSYGCLFKIEKSNIFEFIDILIKNKFIELKVVNYGFFVLRRTKLGLEEIYKKKFEIKEQIKTSSKKIILEDTKISSSDQKLFKTFDFFLNKYNDFQKKAIISTKKDIVCIAGAGSGKTTVLIKRIEFLIKFRGVLPKEILAITFTKKAKEEMIKRLEEINILNVKVETFNSFCEKILKKYQKQIYNREVKIITYREKIAILKNVLNKLNFSFELFIDDYFNKSQVKQKSFEDLFFVFVNDIFSIIDFYKSCFFDFKKDDSKFSLLIKKFYEKEKNCVKKRIAKMIYQICTEVVDEIKRRNFRDFSDQIIDVLSFFKNNSNFIPNFKYILVDEFQDVNRVQIDLLKILNSENLFVVGDPRQAIYGWRGSNIDYILDFKKIFNKENTQIIQLKINYRSDKNLVDFMNLSIKEFGFVDLKSYNLNSQKNIFLIENDSEIDERRFVLESIKSSKFKPNQIFVLARTNKIIDNFAEFFSQNKLKYALKTEQEFNKKPNQDEIILATIHSIKGMQAKQVYLVGANTFSFPNKVVDNFVFNLVKQDFDYDKFDEEKRLFYVGVSRAEEKLILTYCGNYSKFITDKMLEFLDFKKKNKSLFSFANSKNINKDSSQVLKNILKDWRLKIANNLNLPSYMIISNKAIDDLIIFRPKNKNELINISGLGPVKIAKYGDEIIKIINGGN